MGKLLHGFANIEPAIASFKTKVMELARDQDAGTDVVAAALADVIGTAAALLDSQDGRYALPERLGLFNKRVEEAYKRVRNACERVQQQASG